MDGHKGLSDGRRGGGTPPCAASGAQAHGMGMRKGMWRGWAALAAVNAALYAGFLAAELSGAGFGVWRPAAAVGQAAFHATLPDIMKYASIIACLVAAAVAARRGQAWRGRDGRLQAAAFAFTVAADFFLLFTDCFAVGVLVFFGAHLAAIRRYEGGGGIAGTEHTRGKLQTANCKPQTPDGGGRFAAGCVCAAAAVGLAAAAGMARRTLGMPDASLAAALPGAFTPVNVFCVCYGALIGLATAGAFRARQPRANALLSRLGMCLFIACDICVALANALPDAGGAHAVRLLIWVFYMPAQTLLAMSVGKWGT